ncbi:TonB family protein [Brevundimonas sp.]|uniref:TonB family protein n=1 Tax=Brevundimonas sp. TaxID=1871086 RepID=UPI001ACFF162|nr:TonB family protein [Brevundimonas sp.]MBN9466785.1 energy transducer TonB [Brevundimonas sp.]
MDQPSKRRSNRSGLGRSVVLGLVVGGHALIGAGFLYSADDRAKAVGGAPVINLTLTPRVRFDGSGASQAAETAPTGASGGSAAPDAARPRPAALVPGVSPSETLSAITPIETAPPGDNPASAGPISPRTGQESADGPGSAEASPNGMTSGGGARTLGGAAASEEDAYAAAVIAWVERHKGRPRGGLRGDVVLRFILDRRGRLRDIDIIGSGGSHALNRTALDALQTAQPFPQPPAGSTWRTREFRVRLQYLPPE